MDTLDDDVGVTMLSLLHDARGIMISNALDHNLGSLYCARPSYRYYNIS